MQELIDIVKSLRASYDATSVLLRLIVAIRELNLSEDQLMMAIRLLLPPSPTATSLLFIELIKSQNWQIDEVNSLITSLEWLAPRPQSMWQPDNQDWGCEPQPIEAENITDDLERVEIAETNSADEEDFILVERDG